tara:strand:- start:23 stop:574 length:552 start_codon:yes stop_codon:yes gene_type:complete
MAEVAIKPVDIEKKSTSSGRNAGSPYLNIKAATPNGNRTLLVFEPTLFQGIQEAANQKIALRVRVGDTERDQNHIKQIVGKFEEPLADEPEGATEGAKTPAPSARTTEFYQFKPMNPEDRMYDLRKVALNNASAVSLERIRQNPDELLFEPSEMAHWTLRVADMYYEWLVNEQPEEEESEDGE